MESVPKADSGEDGYMTSLTGLVLGELSCSIGAGQGAMEKVCLSCRGPSFAELHRDWHNANTALMTENAYGNTAVMGLAFLDNFNFSGWSTTRNRKVHEYSLGNSRLQRQARWKLSGDRDDICGVGVFYYGLRQFYLREHP